MKYQAKVSFSFIQYSASEHSEDSQTFELEADNRDEAFRKAFERVIANWDAGTIGITSVELADVI